MDDIVRQLREAADSFCPLSVEDDPERFKDLYLKAADAIEDLRMTIEEEGYGEDL
jgi:hypothetical protein